METDDKDALRQRALDVLHGGAWPVGSAAEKEARTLLPELRKQRQFELLAQLSERLLRDHPEEALIRRLHVPCPRSKQIFVPALFLHARSTRVGARCLGRGKLGGQS